MKSDSGDYISKIYEKLNKRFLLLINRDDFQADVLDFRKKWEIKPEELKTNDDSQEWWRRFREKEAIWYREEWPIHRAKLIQMDKDFPKTQDYKSRVEYEEAANLTNPLNAFYHELRAIVRKYRLPPKWEHAIRSYIFNNKPQYHGMTGLTIETSMRGTDSEGQIKVILDGFTTKQDLMDSWPDIKFHLEKLRLREKYQPFKIEVLERNKLAYELREQGKKHSDIAKTLSDRYGEAYVYSDIPTMIRNYKRLSGIN